MSCLLWHVSGGIGSDGVPLPTAYFFAQVQRTCAALAAAGFMAPRTMECLLRSYEVHSQRITCDLDKADAAAAAATESKKRKREGSGGLAAEGDSSASDLNAHANERCVCSREARCIGGCASTPL